MRPFFLHFFHSFHFFYFFSCTNYPLILNQTSIPDLIGSSLVVISAFAYMTTNEVFRLPRQRTFSGTANT